MTDYYDWVVPYGQQLNGKTHEGWLKEYNDWVFGDSYPAQPTGALILQGTVGSSAANNVSATINTNDAIVLHVIGANIIGVDYDKNGFKFDTDDRIRKGSDDSEQEDSVKYVDFRKTSDAENSTTSLIRGVCQVKMAPVNTFVSPNNPDLSKWKPPMPSGTQRSAWTSQLLLMKIPETGTYVLRSNAEGERPYAQIINCTINVR